MNEDATVQATLAAADAGDLACQVAGRVGAHGYEVRFPAGRGRSVFTVVLPGGPEAEVTVEEDGFTGCLYTGRTLAEAAQVIGRLPAPGMSDGVFADGDVRIATWDGIGVDWHYLSSRGQSAHPETIASFLIDRLAIITGGL
jgi:hypothetical protein